MELQGNGRSFIRHYLYQMTTLLMDSPIDSMMDLLELLIWVRERGKRVFTFGNGGSAASASHLACDLAKGTINGSRKRFKVICLSDNVPLITAWANDEDYSDIFVQQLDPLVEADDVVIGISGSGNSANVIRAIELANARRASTVGFSGFDGGLLSQTAAISIVVPSDNMQQVEDAHMIMIHLLTTYLHLGIHERNGFTDQMVRDLESKIGR